MFPASENEPALVETDLQEGEDCRVLSFEYLSAGDDSAEKGKLSWRENCRF